MPTTWTVGCSTSLLNRFVLMMILKLLFVIVASFTHFKVLVCFMFHQNPIQCWLKIFYLDICYRWWTVKTWSGYFHDKTSTFPKNSSRVRLFIAFKVLIFFLSYSFIEPCPTTNVELFTFLFFILTLICRYDPRKGFFCQVINGDHTKCLGKSKGRRYPMMDAQSAKYLQVLYQYFFMYLFFKI